MNSVSSRAYSLTEMMVALAISAAVATGVYRLIRTQAANASRQHQASQHLRSSQRGQLLLKEDLSQAGFDPRQLDLSRVAISPLSLAANDHIVLQSDFDMNGTVGDVEATKASEIVEYQYDANLRQVKRNGTAFLTDVDQFSFTYYDASNTPADAVPSTIIPTLGLVKKVRVKWSQQGSSSQIEQYELTVNLRNFRSS